jgi:hypothetical protein
MYSLTSDMQTPRELLPVFYKQYDLNDDGGHSSSYVRIELTKKILLYIPNFDARRKAVFKHDIHHIATGYTSTFKGETEISAWEIASGCRHYWVAWVLDMQAIMIGMLFNPLGVYKAFVKGRRTKNLYNDAFADEQLMDMPLSEIKESLLLTNYPQKKKGNLIDLILFLLMLLLGVVYAALSLVLLPFVLFYTLYIMLSNKKRGMA